MDIQQYLFSESERYANNNKKDPETGIDNLFLDESLSMLYTLFGITRFTDGILDKRQANLNLSNYINFWDDLGKSLLDTLISMLLSNAYMFAKYLYMSAITPPKEIKVDAFSVWFAAKLLKDTNQSQNAFYLWMNNELPNGSLNNSVSSPALSLISTDILDLPLPPTSVRLYRGLYLAPDNRFYTESQITEDDTIGMIYGPRDQELGIVPGGITSIEIIAPWQTEYPAFAALIASYVTSIFNRNPNHTKLQEQIKGDIVKYFIETRPRLLNLETVFNVIASLSGSSVRISN